MGELNNFEEINSLISSFSGQRNIITIPAVYVEILGDYHTAFVLNQIIFWSDKSTKTDGYFYKSYSEFTEETFLSEYQIRRAANKLKELGFIDTKLRKVNGTPTLHYKFYKFIFSEFILKFIKNRNQSNLRMESEESSVSSITEEYIQKNTNINNSESFSPKKQSTNFNEQLLQENFNRLWELYPKGRKQGKDKAFISYKKAIKDGVTDEVIEKSIEDYKKQIAIQHTELQFIKQGSTWFNQKCWDDEYITENYSKNSGRLKNDRVTQEDEKYFEEIGW